MLILLSQTGIACACSPSSWSTLLVRGALMYMFTMLWARSSLTAITTLSIFSLLILTMIPVLWVNIVRKGILLSLLLHIGEDSVMRSLLMSQIRIHYSSYRPGWFQLEPCSNCYSYGHTLMEKNDYYYYCYCLFADL